jgi:ABC-type Fe3+-citrate transport system substrate-binding protein
MLTEKYNYIEGVDKMAPTISLKTTTIVLCVMLMSFMLGGCNLNKNKDNGKEVTDTKSDQSYLECKVKVEYSSEKQDEYFSVSIDRATKRIAHTDWHGRIFNTLGHFTADTITYRIAWTMTYAEFDRDIQINRVDLNVIGIQNVQIPNQGLHFSHPITGKCKIITVPDRKI